MSLAEIFAHLNLSDVEMHFRKSLSQGQSDVLETLEEQPGHVMSRPEIMNKCGMPLSVSEEALKICVQRIRKNADKVNLGYCPIETVYGLGYIAMTIPHTAPKPNQRIQLGKHAYIDKRNYTLVNRNKRTQLQPAEYDVANPLLSSPLRVYTRSQLGAQFTQANLAKLEKNRDVDSSIKRFRHKLSAVGLSQDIIKTNYNLGWHADITGLDI